MRHGSLFSGIGGFDLAAEWMGWVNVFHCEWNPFGQRVLKYYWPHAKSYADITRTDFTIHRGTIDILTGGFPCQPYSTAGKRKGKADERHLWPEMLRAIREIAPRYIVGENVLGLVNWDGGMVFDEVQTDLESAGYEVATVVIPAAAVNAPHGRDRVWFVAQNTMHSRCVQRKLGEERTEVWKQRNTCTGDSERVHLSKRYASNTESVCIQRQRNGQGKGEFGRGNWCRFPTQPPICGGDDGLPRELDGITFSKWRNESIKAYGNAIVPQVAFEIFKVI
jgi:DNA (cytosine-5)-methyltransferase 1